MVGRVLVVLRRLVPLRGGVAATVQTVVINILLLGLNFGTGVITARVLGPEGRGVLAAMQMWPQFLAYTLTLGLPSALLYNLRRHPERGSQLFSAALLLGTLMGGIATVVGILLIPLWLTEYSPEVVLFAQWAMLAAPMFFFYRMFTDVLRAREEFTLHNALRCLHPLLVLPVLGLLALAQHLTPFSAVLAYMLPALPLFLWTLVRLWRLYRPAWRGLSPAFKYLISYASRSSVVELGGHLSYQVDRVLLVGLVNPVAMGLYVVAWSLSDMLTAFQSAVVTVLFPKASGGTVEEVVYLTGRAVRVTIAATIPTAAGLALFSPWALRLVYGEEYLDATLIFRLLLLVKVLSGTRWVLSQAFMAVDRPGVASVLQGIGVSLSVLLLLILVPRYGLEGAGLALLISSIIRLVIMIACFPLVLKVRAPRLLLTRADLAAILYREKERP
jgi:antigen flippase